MIVTGFNIILNILHRGVLSVWKILSASGERVED